MKLTNDASAVVFYDSHSVSRPIVIPLDRNAVRSDPTASIVVSVDRAAIAPHVFDDDTDDDTEIFEIAQDLLADRPGIGAAIHRWASNIGPIIVLPPGS